MGLKSAYIKAMRAIFEGKLNVYHHCVYKVNNMWQNVHAMSPVHMEI